MSHTVVKVIKGIPYSYQVRSERKGNRVVQIYEKYLGRIDDALAKKMGLQLPTNITKENDEKTPHWYVLRKEIYKRDKGICWICHNPIPSDEYELGHLVDRCNGGHTDYDNLAAMHAYCNQHKPSHKTIQEHLEWLLKTRYFEMK